MGLRVTQPDFKTCPYRWILVVDGVDAGVGEITTDVCQSLSGRFKLDYKACSSSSVLIVWESECTVSPSGRVEPKWRLVYDVPATMWRLRSFSDVDFPKYERDEPLGNPCNLNESGYEKRLHLVDRDGDDGCDLFPSVVVITRSCPPERAARTRKVSGRTGKTLALCPCDCQDEPSDLRDTCQTRADGGDFVAPCAECCPCYASIEWTVDGFTPQDSLVEGNWPILRNTQSYPPGLGLTCSQQGYTETFPRCTWGDHSSDISFNVHSALICSQVWSAALSVTCDPVTCKATWTFYYSRHVPCGQNWSVTYTAVTDVWDGCGQQPLTLTRPDMDVGFSVSCLNQSSGGIVAGVPLEIALTPTTGCETPMSLTCGTGYEEPDYDPEDCKYPTATDCCDYCVDQDPPCAYEATIGCDLSHDGIPIMAKTVTLRHKCYFEDTCDWVAVGPSPNEADGGLGAQPTCATCVDSCLSGCSWDAWQAATCPQGPCGPNLCDEDAVFTFDMPALNDFYTGLPCTDAETITLTYNAGYWVCTTAQFSVYMRLQENCVSISIETVGSFIDCTFGCEGEIYFGTPTSGGCPTEFVFTLLPQCVGFGYPTTITVTRV